MRHEFLAQTLITQSMAKFHISTNAGFETKTADGCTFVAISPARPMGDGALCDSYEVESVQINTQFLGHRLWVRWSPHMNQWWKNLLVKPLLLGVFS